MRLHILELPKQMPFIEEVAISKKDCQSKMESISSFTEGTKPRQASLASPKAGPVQACSLQVESRSMKEGSIWEMHSCFRKTQNRAFFAIFRPLEII